MLYHYKDVDNIGNVSLVVQVHVFNNHNMWDYILVGIDRARKRHPVY